MKHKIYILIVLLLAANFSFGQFRQDTTKIYDFKPVPFYAYYLPGGTHFYKGEIGKGLFFSASEIGLLTTGLILNKKFKNSETFQINAPLLFAGHVYIMDKADYLLSSVRYVYQKNGKRYDYHSFKDLALAPLNPKIIVKPIVLSAIALGVINAFLPPLPAKKYSLQNVTDVEGYGMPMSKGGGTFMYGLSSAAISYGAGMTEEVFFRGMLMPMWDHRFGQKNGLLFSSLAFSAAHIPNYIATKDPWMRLYYIADVTLIAYALGRNVQNNNYDLRQAIAAHAWYDFTLMMLGWLRYPDDNIFGFNVKFNF